MSNDSTTQDITVNGETYRYDSHYMRIKINSQGKYSNGWKIYQKFDCKADQDAEWKRLLNPTLAGVLVPEESNYQSIGNLDESSNLQSIANLPNSDLVVQYHLAAERCANLSVWCAAMAGAEISKQKKELGHGGGFTTWRNSLPFSQRTAANYVNLAKQLEQRLNLLPADRRAALLPAITDVQNQTENMLELLNLPSPMDVFNPAHTQLAEVIRDVTSGQTITQLYFDWDICKAPKRAGGNMRLLAWLNAHHRDLVEQCETVEDLPDHIREEYEKYLDEGDDPIEKAKAKKEFYGHIFVQNISNFRVLIHKKDCMKHLTQEDARAGYQALVECVNFLRDTYGIA